VKEKVFLKLINEVVPEKVRKINIDAFKKGREIIQSMQEVQSSNDV
jgi:hypothetical protein